MAMTNLEIETLQAVKHYCRRNTFNTNAHARERETINMFSAAVLPFWLEHFSNDGDLSLNRLIEAATATALRTATDIFDKIDAYYTNNENEEE